MTNRNKQESSLFKLLFLNAFITILLLLILEGVLVVLYQNPVNDFFLSASRDFYHRFDRDSIAYTDKCARYDKDIAYTLRPGECNYKEQEYNIHLEINRAGLRDDEKSLIKPEVIFLGDSHTMGWGVERYETFAHQVEQKTGLNILNAAIPSYGTVREMMMLSRIDRSKLKYIIIQYCDNDYGENESFFNDKDGKLDIMSEALYNDRAEKLGERPYYLGKYLYRFLPIIAKQHRNDTPVYGVNLRRNIEVEVRDFIHAFIHSDIDFSEIEIFIFEVSGNNSSSTRFINLLKEKLVNAPFEKNRSPLNISTFDMTPYLDNQHFFKLDGHINRKGHKKIADLILEKFPFKTFNIENK